MADQTGFDSDAFLLCVGHVEQAWYMADHGI